MEYILAGKTDKADSLWNQYMINTESVMFRRLLQESYVRKEPQIIHKLIDSLKLNKAISLGTLGNAYSRLINYYVTENQIQEAEKTLEDATQCGLTAENLNKSCFIRLKTALESQGKQFNYVF